MGAKVAESRRCRHDDANRVVDYFYEYLGSGARPSATP